MPLRIMPVIFCSLLLVQAICLGQTTLEQTSSETTENLAFIAPMVQQEIDAEKLVGAVTWIWQDGRVIHHQAHGLRDRKSQSPMQRDTIFRIHSFTKAITTTAAMMLWEEGKFQLDDPVEKYLPQLADREVYDPAGNQLATRPMTVRDLMRHTSGLIYGYENGEGLDGIYGKADLFDIDTSLAEFITRLSKLPLKFSPGEQLELRCFHRCSRSPG